MKRRCFLGSIVDGTGVLGTEAGVGPCMFEWEVIEVEELELVNHESELPGKVCWLKILEGSVGHGDEGHVYRELMWWAVLYSISSCLACQRFDLGSQVFSDDGCPSMQSGTSVILVILCEKQSCQLCTPLLI